MPGPKKQPVSTAAIPQIFSSTFGRSGRGTKRMASGFWLAAAAQRPSSLRCRGQSRAPGHSGRRLQGRLPCPWIMDISFFSGRKSCRFHLWRVRPFAIHRAGPAGSSCPADMPYCSPYLSRASRHAAGTWPIPCVSHRFAAPWRRLEAISSSSTATMS